MKYCHNMPLKHEQRPNCGIYHVYMIFDMTMVTDEKFHSVLKFVRMTMKSCTVVKIDDFTKYNIKSVLLNRFRRNKILMKAN